MWYNNDDFLVRWRNKMKTHSVRTESDLYSIIRFNNDQNISQPQQANYSQTANRNRQDNDTVPHTTK